MSATSVHMAKEHRTSILRFETVLCRPGDKLYVNELEVSRVTVRASVSTSVPVIVIEVLVCLFQPLSLVVSFIASVTWPPLLPNFEGFEWVFLCSGVHDVDCALVR